MSPDKGAVYLLIFMFLFFVNTNAKIKVCFPKVCFPKVCFPKVCFPKVCFPYSHNNPFAGKHMGRHIKLYMLGYALGPYE